MTKNQSEPTFIQCITTTVWFGIMNIYSDQYKYRIYNYSETWQVPLIFRSDFDQVLVGFLTTFNVCGCSETQKVWEGQNFEKKLRIWIF